MSPLVKMSKIGKLAISLPEQVEVQIQPDKVVVSGPKGELTIQVPKVINVKKENSQLLISRTSEDKPAKALHGTIRQILANMIVGVTQGWDKTLEIVGTGYRASLKGENLDLALGFSHPVEVVPPAGIKFEVIEGKIRVSGSDKILVGQVAANIRKIRPPDAYKGKGIRYGGEKIKLKPGKAAKVGAPGGA